MSVPWLTVWYPTSRTYAQHTHTHTHVQTQTSSTSVGLDALCVLCFSVIPRLSSCLLSSLRPTGLSFSHVRSRSPRYMDRRKSPSSLSYQQAVLSLTRAQPSSCALVTYGSRVTNPSGWQHYAPTIGRMNDGSFQ